MLNYKICLLVATMFVFGCGDDNPQPRAASTVFAEWAAIEDRDRRTPLAEELIEDDHLIGLSREEVVSRLGPGNARPMSDAYGDPKYIVGPNGLDDMWLCIHIEDDSVVRAELRSD